MKRFKAYLSEKDLIIKVNSETVGSIDDSQMAPDELKSRIGAIIYKTPISDFIKQLLEFKNISLDWERNFRSSFNKSISKFSNEERIRLLENFKDSKSKSHSLKHDEVVIRSKIDAYWIKKGLTQETIEEIYNYIGGNPNMGKGEMYLSIFTNFKKAPKGVSGDLVDSQGRHVEVKTWDSRAGTSSFKAHPLVSGKTAMPKLEKLLKIQISAKTISGEPIKLIFDKLKKNQDGEKLLSVLSELSQYPTTRIVETHFKDFKTIFNSITTVADFTTLIHLIHHVSYIVAGKIDSFVFFSNRDKKLIYHEVNNQSPNINVEWQFIKNNFDSKSNSWGDRGMNYYFE